MQIKESWSGHTVSGGFVPPYTSKQVNAVQKKLNTLESSDVELRDIGYRLFCAISGLEATQAKTSKPAESPAQSVLKSVIQRTLKRRGTVALTLVFGPGCEEFVRYPWELLNNGNHFLIASGIFTLSRALLRPDAPIGSELPVHPPFRILYISASPTNFAPLETERSFEAMEEALTPLIETGQIFLDRLEPPTFSEFVRYLNSYGGAGTFDDSDTTLPCYVVHFDGHGAYGKLCPKDGCETVNNPDGRKCCECGTSLLRIPAQTYLCFCDEDGYNSFVDTQSLRRVLVSSDVHLAVFSACETATVCDEEQDCRPQQSQKLAAVDSTLATSLVTAQVPAVVAMPFSLQDDLSPTFMYHFYEALADGRTLEEALSRARQAMLPMQQKSWFIPVLYRHVAEGDEGPVALMVTADTEDEHAHPLSHLAPSTNFIGRERELHDIEQLLIQAATSQESARIRKGTYKKTIYHHIALTGSPGIGKSALALEAIRRNRDKFLGGILGVSLENGKLFADALLEMAHALQIPARSVANSDARQRSRLVQGVLRSLASRELSCLLLLDSFEQVKDRAELEQWLVFLSSLPQEVVVLVTSHSNPESMLIVGGLSSRWYEYRVGKMNSADLLMLFFDLAATSGLDQRIQLNDPHQQVVLQEICTLLDGYPLGAELIFGTARSIGGQVFTPEAATRSLEEVRDELYSHPLAGILAALEVSYQRLSPPARLLLSYLAAFRIPFNREQISMLISPDTLLAAHEPTPTADKNMSGNVPESLGSLLPQQWRAARDELVQASIVLFDGRTYSIHPQIRHFALTRLPLEERRRVHRVVAAYYYCLPQPDAEEWIEAFEHLEAASQAQDLQEAIRVVLRAADFFEGQGLFTTLQTLLRRAAGYATRMGDQSSVGLLQARLGALLRQLGQFTEAEACLRNSLGIHQQQEDIEQIGWSCYELALLCFDQGYLQQSLKYARQAQTQFEKSDQRRGQALVLNVLGMVRRGQARYAEALEYLEQAMNACYQLSEGIGRARAVHQRGIVYASLGQYSRAVRDFEEALRLFYDLKRPMDQNWVLASKCAVHVWQGKQEQAEKICLEVLQRFREYHVQRGEGLILRTLGELYLQKQDMFHAHNYYSEAWSIFNQLGDRLNMASTFYLQAELSILKGEYLEAKDNYEQAQIMAQECEATHLQGLALCGQGDVARVLRQFREAEHLYLEADRLLESIALQSGRFKVLDHLGQLYESQHRYQDALATWVQALTLNVDEPAGTRASLQEKVRLLAAEKQLDGKNTASKDHESLA
ncbi:CHAT domain-containing tetratricopeptide repeat protein [Dictyobacter alpinus]|uniref:CHAT domain-containing tetratricopeptide repeat protein n=1 Tax=Dictyobacter alpinus TaxID=2014873 RepID=UPI0013872B5F|nr:tetratricopeptide repeat protein [Dictyobacter alpinus]